MYKDYEIKLNAILDKHKGVQKVEFKDLKELKTYIKFADRSIKQQGDTVIDLADAAAKVRKVRTEVKAELSIMESSLDTITNVMNTFKNNANKLGVNPETVKEYNDLGKQADRIEKQNKTIAKLLKEKI
tara:strand:- start:735 stop:1121 length:387 start_codon:yes stop_codon:yes gene_type:complete